jgi:hypothetical protein
METNNRSVGVFSLPLLLNILVRRWRLLAACAALGVAAGVAYGIVVEPLYRATAQIRPGIVAYTVDGAPLRGWAREDIIHWFENDLFWQHMRETPGLDHLKHPPVIDATYTASNIQFMPGGDVITLTNLSTSPDEARRVLDTAMAAFNLMGRTDSLGGDLTLAVRGIEIAMDDIAADLALVDGKEDRARLEIEALRREIALLDFEEKKVELQIETLSEENGWRRRTVEALTAEAASGAARLARAEEMLALSLQAEKEAGGGLGHSAGDDPVDTVLRQTASREQAGRVGELLVRVNDLSALVNENRIRADSLRVQITETDNEVARLRMVSAIVLTKERSDFQQQIADKEIVLARELASERAHLKSQLAGKQVQLDMISPLELVGSTTVTDKPVRPRKMRALTILTILALLGGVFLALAREYFDANRATIMQRPGV